MPEIEGDLISEEEKSQLKRHDDDDELIRFIARRWGLSLDEAMRVRAYNSYGALRLDTVENKLGVVYFDSKARNAFGDKDEMSGVRAALVDQLKHASIIDKLLEIHGEVDAWSGRLQIYRNS